MSVARQFGTARTTRSLLDDPDVADDVNRGRGVDADGGAFDEELVAMIAANSDDATRLVAILNGHPKLIARLTAESTPDSAQRALARGLAKGDVDASEVRAVLRKADAASPENRRLLFDVSVSVCT